MSVNWVMLSPASTPPFTALPHEQILFTSSPRIAFSLSTPSTNNNIYPGRQPPAQQPFSLSATSGILYLTNRRIIYLPDKSTPQLQSFAAPILSLHDSHVAAPWFGPNVWTAMLQPTSGGGIPATSLVEVKLTFKEGGAFDFHTQYERVRERLMQAVEAARADGRIPTGAAGAAAGPNGVDVAAGVNLEDLPAYQERGDGPLVAPIVQTVAVEDAGERRRGHVPEEPPPGYEEAVVERRGDEKR